MSIGKWLGETLFGAGRELVNKLQRFQRTRSKEQQRAELEQWDRNHIPAHFDPLGACVVCDRPRAVDTEHCPGPVKKWRATRPETPKCAALFKHETLPGFFEPGCEICDPGRTRRPA